jgi:glutamine synthetase type III
MNKKNIFEYEKLLYWPQDGNIHIFDTLTQEFKVITLEQFYTRYNHLKYVFKNGGYYGTYDERLKMERNLENMRKCIKIAASQLEEKNLKEFIPAKMDI